MGDPVTTCSTQALGRLDWQSCPITPSATGKYVTVKQTNSRKYFKVHEAQVWGIDP